MKKKQFFYSHYWEKGKQLLRIMKVTVFDLPYVLFFMRPGIRIPKRQK